MRVPLSLPRLLGCALGVLTFLSLSAPANAQQHEDFDSYQAGKTVVGQGGWQEWSAGSGALVSTTQALSLANSIDITGPSDLVHEYFGLTHGTWEYRAMQYIPSGLDKKSYFILMSSWGATNKWAVQVGFNPTTGNVEADAGGAGATTKIVYDKWVEVKAVIHLDSDWVQFYYDGNLLDAATVPNHPVLGGGWSWSGGPFGSSKGPSNIAAVDLFANGSTKSVFYDEISLRPYPNWADDFDTYADKSQVVKQGGWEEWSAGAGAVVSTVQHNGPGNSIDITGPSDLVHQYKGYTEGRWEYSAMQYIPTGLDKKSYFILLSSFGSSNKWAVQVGANPSTGNIEADAGGGPATTKIVYDKWVPLRVVIDLEADWVQFYYNGTLLDSSTVPDHPILGGGWKWTGGPFGTTNGPLNIAAVDLFANGSTKSVFYDDVSLMPLPAHQTNVGVIRASAPSTLLTVGTGGTVPGTAVEQVSFQPLPGGNPGQYLCCMTVNGLASQYGAVGSRDGLIGTLDVVKGTFTPTAYAKAMNSTGYDFGLMVDPKGLFAVIDHPDGVYFGSRGNLTSSFTNVTKVSQITGTYVDPSLGYIGGQLMLFWAENNMIAMQPFDSSAVKLTGTKLYVAKSAKGGTVNSPTPMTGKDGDVEGLWLADLKGSDNDMVFAEDLDANTPVQTLVDTTNWINNGGVAGAMLAWADGASGYHVQDLIGSWLLGDEETLGGTVDITGAAPTNGGKTMMFDVVAMSTKTMLALPIPGFTGQFGLNIPNGFVFAATTHKGADDLWSVSFPIPNVPVLHGLKVAVQAISFDQALSTIVFSNTAQVLVK